MIDFTLNDIEKILDRGFEKQAVIIRTAFQDQKDYYDQQFTKVRDDIQKLQENDQRIEGKLDRALYTDLTTLERRVSTLKIKAGIKPT